MTTEITLSMLSASMTDEFCYFFTEKQHPQSKSSSLFTSHFYTKLVVLWHLTTPNNGIIP